MKKTIVRGGWAYKALIAGIDTLEIGYCIDEYLITQDEWDLIEAAKASAQSTLFDKGSGIEFRGHSFVVLRGGSSRYKYVLDNDDLQIRFFAEARSGKNFPEVKVVLKSQFLWRHGWKDAVTRVDTMVHSLAKVASVKVSRIDITVDFLGELPKLTPGLRDVIARGRRKSERGQLDYERHADGTGEKTYTFGTGDLLCRIYDKTAEILKSHKQWFEPLWKEHGWLEGQPVVRVEFQCRRKIIRLMQIDSIDALFLQMADLWKYLSEKWLTIRMIKDDANRNRWPISPFWQVVQSAGCEFGQVTGVSRLRQLRPKVHQLEILAEGVFASIVALSTESLPRNDLKYGKRYATRLLLKWLRDPDFDAKAEKRRHKYGNMDNGPA